MVRKGHPSKREKEKLDNTKVPNVTLRGALKKFREGDPKEADRRWNLIKDQEKK